VCSRIQVRSTSSCSGVWATAPSTPRPPALVTAAATSRQCVKAKMGKSIPNNLAPLVFIAFRLSAYRSWPVASLGRRRRGFLRVCRSTASLTASALTHGGEETGPRRWSDIASAELSAREHRSGVVFARLVDQHVRCNDGLTLA